MATVTHRLISHRVVTCLVGLAVLGLYIMGVLPPFMYLSVLVKENKRKGV